MSVINTNITSMIAQQNLNSSKGDLTTAMERLSSGLRINSAKDDAAGQAIANRMSSQITGLSQAQRNANDGISVAQTAEGALNQINDNLQRVRELSVQAQNGTNSAGDLESIQNEITQRLGEIDRISEQTDFNGTKVLDGSKTTIDIQVGADDGQSITINLQKMDAASLNLGTFTVSGTMVDNTAADATALTTAGFTTDAALDADGATAYSSTNDAADSSDVGASLAEGDTVDIDGTVYTKQADGTYDDGSSPLADDTALQAALEGATAASTTSTGYTVANGAGGAVTETASGDAAYVDADSALTTDEGKITYFEQADGTVNTASDGSGDQVYAKADDTLTTEASSIVAGTKTEDPLAALDSALGQVDALRSDLGAIQNRFDSAITNLATTETNLSAARSRIEDADYASEVANMTRAQILQQAGTSVLAQANQVPQSVLSLLG